MRHDRREGDGGGMGNPHEVDYFYTNFRDPGQAEPRPKDVVTEARRKKVSPQKGAEFDEFFFRFAQEIKKAILFTKRPAFLEQPFFGKPVVKLAEVVAPSDPAGTTSTIILDRTIAARQRAIVTAIGVDTDHPEIVDAHQLAFSFRFDDLIIPFFDDQTAAALLPAVFRPLPIGETTNVPGSAERPFNLIDRQVQFEVIGPKRLTFQVRNVSDEDVRVKAMMTFYQYWTPNSSEFEAGDLQH